ncbi:DUF1501 domain-containing protein [Ottowia sp.]|uniref:DUF1501 domain-containing protein n=1 Tax=Ottowia sp. TaxID=1898956 RepID=UPI002D1311F8|nr:DUF1501 domain-containing protein [Ottowia sp.]HOB65440.1 DUF1501 domain-containing protein [Ottowia sp.]HPZ57484.1 DUF1501 domain-containing protein [Ottowia sp.]HQD46474.1 DUF1501 domain-containing protein [Ottowia sp.]
MFSSSKNSNPATAAFTRRAVLAGAGAAAVLAAGPRAWPQAAPATGDGRLIVVFLRGALDSLSAFVPYADPHYARLRPSIAIAPPDGSAATAIRLDDRFALHPALAALLPLWQAGQFAFVPAAGSPDGTRSHFDAQYQWETARPGQRADAPGWLNRLAAHLGAAPGGGNNDRPRVIGVGEASPRVLAGAQPVQLVAHGQAARRAGALQTPRQRDALLALYGGDDALSAAFRQGAAARLASAHELSSDMPPDAAREMQAANNGAAPVSLLEQDARNLATLMRRDRRLRLGFLSAGGWDTHVNQGAGSGALAANLQRLAAALMALQRDFNAPGDVIVVASEFGRTVAENGTRGTDHGHGNALWLIGPRVAGGRWHGQWSGLSTDSLHDARDLPAHHDFRAVLAQLLRPGFGLSDSALQDVLPGATWDRALDGLMQRG